MFCPMVAFFAAFVLARCLAAITVEPLEEAGKRRRTR